MKENVVTKYKETVNLKCVGYTEKKEYANDYKFGPGTRNNYTIHYVVKGRGFLLSGGKKYNIQKGESFIIYPDTEVYYYPDKNDPWEYVWVDFVGAEAKNLLKAIDLSPQNPVLPSIEESPYNLFVNLIEGVKNCKSNIKSLDHWFCITSGYLHLIIAYYMRNYPAVNYLTLTGKIAEEAAAYITENIHLSSLSVDSLAIKFSTSRSTLYREFKNTFNLSPIEYINKLKMEEAIKMLTNNSYSVKSISYSLGFNNPMYFSNVFKKYTGMSPTEYRKKRR